MMKKLINEEEYDQLVNEIWQDYLSQATQEEIYYSVIDSNWDDNQYFLNWLLENPKVDKASILAAYWMSEPYFAKQFQNREEVNKKKSWYLDDFDFTENIEKKYIAGFYTESQIACDPKNVELEDNEYAELNDRTKPNISSGKLVREIPKIMFQKIDGKAFDPKKFYGKYIEGLPEDYYKKIEELDEKYELDF